MSHGHHRRVWNLLQTWVRRMPPDVRDIYSRLGCNERNAAVFSESFSNSGEGSGSRLLPCPFAHVSTRGHRALGALCRQPALSGFYAGLPVPTGKNRG